MSINTGIPLGYPVNSVVPGNTVMTNPNAQVVSNSNVQMYNLNGTPVSEGYASPQNPLKILEIFEGWLLVLVPINNNNTEWVIGFFETSTLPNSIEIYENTIIWNDSSNKTVYNSNGDVIYSLPATNVVQYLYTTPDKNYACILFNNANGNLATGYVSTNDGSFSISQTLPTSTTLQPPSIASFGSGSSSNSQPNGAIDTGIPTGSANTIVPGNTVMSNYNAQVTSSSNVQMYTSNGSIVQYGYASPGNYLKVLEINDNGLVLALVPINNANTEWVIGYFEPSTLSITDGSIALFENTITWNDSSDKTVYDANGNVVYSLPASQDAQYLYTTPDGNYACILFNNNADDYALMTGYVSSNTGTFTRSQTPETSSFSPVPSIASGSSSGNTPTPSISGGNNSPASENPEWTNLDLITKTALYIASFEGFSNTPYHCGVGPYAWSIGYGQPAGNKTWVSKPEAFENVITYINSHLSSWNLAISALNIYPDLSDIQYMALYNFAYQQGTGSVNESTGAGEGLKGLIYNINEYGVQNTEQSFGQWVNGTDLQRRMSSEAIAFSQQKLYFGEQAAKVPSEYVSIATSFPSIQNESSEYLPII